ncbi:MAG: ACP S-malonyltransferase [Pseudomonadota bacterium]|nr:ACP S-malonyltransferase [Alphaproteobacteria bacterium]MDP5012239.1 ACP S-malonyltransferase [Alphaproteobacteria bacterium]MDP5370288.1 ACP S-malonyltransferase [Pseudomonadota bacterium]
MTFTFVFPGQGSQAINMGRDLYDNFKAARLVVDEVEDALQEKLSRTMFEGPNDTLMLTENTQPALLTVSMMAFRVIMDEAQNTSAVLSPMMAGHSLGEYSALCAAGYLSLTDAVRLVRLRGRAMQEAVPVGVGAMAAILGLDLPVVESLLDGFDKPDNFCGVANDNSPGQVVISGHKDAVDEVIKRALDAGAKRGLLLPVSAPFHSPLMEPAARVMEDALGKTTIHDGTSQIIANITAMPLVDKAFITPTLVSQITGRVRWCESVTHMKQLGTTTFVELGSGKVLAGLIKRIEPDVAAISVQNATDVGAFLAMLG